MWEKWKELCRLCAGNHRLLPLLEGECLQKKLALKMTKHLSIDVREAGMPQYICFKCASQLMDWDYLVNTVEATTARFQDWLTVPLNAEPNNEELASKVLSFSAFDPRSVDGVYERQNRRPFKNSFRPVSTTFGPRPLDEPVTQHSIIDLPAPETSTDSTANTLVDLRANLFDSYEKALCLKAWEDIWKSKDTTSHVRELARRERLMDASSSKALRKKRDTLVGTIWPCSTLFPSDVQTSSCELFAEAAPGPRRNPDSTFVTEDPSGDDRPTACSADAEPDWDAESDHDDEAPPAHEDDAPLTLGNVKINIPQPAASCFLCSRSFKTLAMFEVHWSVQHSLLGNEMKRAASALAAGVIICRVCKEHFADRPSLVKHVKLFHPLHPNVCHQCGAFFAQSGYLRRHIADHHESDMAQERAKARVGMYIKGEAFDVTGSTRNTGTAGYIFPGIHIKEEPGGSGDEVVKSCVREKTHQEMCRELILKDRKCNECNVVFGTAHRRKTHFDKAHVNVCRHCSTNFPQRQAWVEHMASEHSETFFCGKCRDSFTTQDELKVHHQAHNPLMACDICGKQYKGMNSLRRHIWHHKNGGPSRAPKEVPCETCGKKLSCAKGLETHVLRCHATEKPFSCEICGKAFAAEFILAQHTKARHTDNTPCICETCGKSFNSLSSLKHHVPIHWAVKPFPCDQCDLTFTTAAVLKQHKKSKSHLDGGRVSGFHSQCHICDKWLRTETMAMYHMGKHDKSTHPYECKHCGKKFRKSTCYLIHVRVHTGERPFVCSVCGKAFRGAGSLRQHAESHDELPKYACKLCGKKFKRSSNIETHMKLHRGIKKHKCLTCGEAFMYKQRLDKHVAKRLCSAESPGFAVMSIM